MRILKTTDTHFGHSERTTKYHRKFLKRIAKEKFDVLIHAGDWISNSQVQMPKTLKMFREYIDKPILAELGNHDLWSSFKDQPVPSKFQKTNHRVRIPYHTMTNNWEKWCKEYDIHYLTRNPYNFKDEVMIYGYDGWYHMPPNTNDVDMMPLMAESAPIHAYLGNRAYKDLDWALFEAECAKLENPDLKTICVTHFPPYTFEKEYTWAIANPRYMDMIVEHFDVLCVGHSHRNEDYTYLHTNYLTDNKLSMRVINAGANWEKFQRRYDAPNYVIFEVN